MVKVLFVCMGNICRSPTAEGVFRKKMLDAGMDDRIEIDSAGTHAYHVGDSPDRRSQAAASKRGFDLSDQRARRVADTDFVEFDYVIAMDSSNYQDLMNRCPVGYEDRVQMFLSYGRKFSEVDVPDPYYGGGRGFEIVLDLIEDAAEGLLSHIRENT